MEVSSKPLTHDSLSFTDVDDMLQQAIALSLAEYESHSSSRRLQGENASITQSCGLQDARENIESITEPEHEE